MSELHEQAELQRMFEETRKFVAEQHKLQAEAQKMTWEQWLAPAVAIGAGVGSFVGAISLVVHLLR